MNKFKKREIGVKRSEISTELFLAGVTVFVIVSIFSGLLGLLVMLRYFNFQTVGYLLNAGVNLFLIGSGLILFSVILMELAQKRC